MVSGYAPQAVAPFRNTELLDARYCNRFMGENHPPLQKPVTVNAYRYAQKRDVPSVCYMYQSTTASIQNKIETRKNTEIM